MPLSLGDLRKSTKEASIKVGDATVNLAYRPFAYTPSVLSRLAESDVMDGAYVEFAALVERWDVTDADGVPVPVTEEGLKAADVPARLLNEVISGVLEAMAPGKPNRTS